MDGRAVDNFVARENIRHFRDELERGVDNDRRSTLLGLLAEEFHKLGLARDQLDSFDKHIARLRALIAGQAKLVEDLTASGQPIERPALVLATLHDLMDCYTAHRERIGAALDGL
jgi:hypothetical protein